jgi:hypothetical protein
VLVFPADSRRWIDNGRYSRRLFQGIATRQGSFTVSNLPSGDYVAVALQDAAPLRWQDPAVLAKLSQSGSPLSLHDGQPATLTLRSIKWPR